MTRTIILLALLTAGCSSRKAEGPPQQESSQTSKASSDPVATDTQVTRFWKWFSDNAAALRADNNLQSVMERINVELEKIDRGVFVEIGNEGSDRLLVISADGNIDLFPVVREIHRAHSSVPGWKFVAFRQRTKPGEPFTLEMGERKVSAADVKFVAEPAGAKLDVQLFLPAYDNSDAMKQLAYILMDHTVGEYDMEMRIRAIDLAPLDAAPAGAKPLTELAAAVDALE